MKQILFISTGTILSWLLKDDFDRLARGWFSPTPTETNLMLFSWIVIGLMIFIALSYRTRRGGPVEPIRTLSLVHAILYAAFITCYLLFVFTAPPASSLVLSGLILIPALSFTFFAELYIIPIVFLVVLMKTRNKGVSMETKN